MFGLLLVGVFGRQLEGVLNYLPWRCRNNSTSSSLGDLESGVVVLPDSQPPSDSDHLSLTPPTSPISNPFSHSSSSATSPSLPAMQNERQRPQATFNYERVAITFLPVQAGFVLALLPVCLVVKLPADWLGIPLITVMCILTLAFLQSSYSLLFAPYLGIPMNEVRLNNIVMISVFLTKVALVITVGTCVTHLTILLLTRTSTREG